MLSRIEVYPDATLPSILSLSLDQGVRGSRHYMGKLIAGVNAARIGGDFPMHLGRVAMTVGRRIGKDVDSLIADHTMLPLYGPWIEAARLAEVKTAMIGDGPIRPHTLLGRHSVAGIAPRRLFFCRDCLASELSCYQTAWWHRQHQAWPWYCPIHGAKMLESGFASGGSWRLDYPMAEDAAPVRPLGLEGSAAKEIAEDIHWLLSVSLKSYGVEALRSAYLTRLSELGFTARRLRRTQFLREFHAWFPRCYLAKTGLSFDPNSPYSWPAKLVVGAGGSHSPIRHLHIVRFLGLSAEEFFSIVESCGKNPIPRERKGIPAHLVLRLQELWAQRRVSIRAMSREFGIGEHTVKTWATKLSLSVPRFGCAKKAARFDKRLRRFRSRWLVLRDHADGVERSRVLKWLSRNDGAWFRLNGRKRKKTVSFHAVDWKGRDYYLARRVPHVAKRIRELRPFRRISPTSIAESIGAPFIIQASMNRLPRFSSAVCKMTESYHAFSLRRIRALRKEQPNATSWRIRDLACIERPLPRNREILRALGYPPDYQFKCRSR